MAWSRPTSTKDNPTYDPDDGETIQTRHTLKLYDYDEESDRKIKRLSVTHNRPKRLKAKIDDTTQDVIKATEAKRQNLRMGLSYDEFMRGLLYRDESSLLRSQFLRYEKVVFSYEQGDVKNKKKTMSEGRAILTNHRILFLSNEEIQKIYFSEISKEKPEKKSKRERKKEEERETPLVAVSDDLSTVDLTKAYMDIKEKPPYVLDPSLSKSKYYALIGRARDIIQYFSIPLGCIKNVELDGDMSAISLSIIKRKKPFFLLRLCGCCGGKMCTKSWNNDATFSGTSTERVLSLGVHLPPWGYKCYVNIYVSEDQNAEILRDIIVNLQHYAPDLYTGKMVYHD